MTGPPPTDQAREVTADLIALPDTPLADAIVHLIRPVETPSVFNHSIRTYLFARLVAARLALVVGRDYNDDLLFAACAMHDLGVASDGPHSQRFDVEGADRAAEFLIERGMPAADAVHAAYPRLEMIRSLTDAIVAQAAKNPKNAPRYAIPGEFLREREAFGQTRLEHACRSSRWGS